jgi:SH3-like domain-containing protein
MKPFRLRFALFVLCVLAAVPLASLGCAVAAVNGGSGLPLPRFVSLRSEEANLRSGPGTRYPVDWVYTRRDLPVEVIAEFDAWRKIRDWQGTEGWLHETFLSSKRTVVVTGERRRLRTDPDDKAPAVALLDPNVIGKLLTCPHQQNYCRIEVQNYQGWLRRDEFWGVYPGEYIE